MQPQYYGAAAQYNKPTGSNFKRLLMITLLGIGVIVLLSIGFVVLNVLTSGPRNDFARLVARQEVLQEFVSSNQKNIHSGDLSKINSTANALLLTDSSALATSLQKAYGVSKIPGNIAQSEADTTSETKLQEAMQLNRFDQTYYQMLRDRIAATLSLAQQIRPEARGSAKTTVQQVINNLNAIDDELNKLSL